MKILQVISTPPFAWETGGCARVAFGLSRGLARIGHEVKILTTDLYKSDARWSSNGKLEIIDGVEILRFKDVNHTIAWKKKIYISPGIINYLRKNITQFDIVHLHDLISIQAIATSRYCEKFNKKYFLTTHGSIPWTQKNNLINRIYLNFFGKKILSRATKVLTLNETEANICHSMGIKKDNIEILPNGIDLSEYSQIPKRGNLKGLMGIDNKNKIILYLGRIHRSKGLSLLVEAAKIIFTDYDDFTIVFIGPDDGYGQDLRKKIDTLGLSGKVVFTGFLPENEKYSALLDADVFVTPLFTGFPITFIESLICGTPILTTNEGDSLGWIDGNVGFVTEYTPEELAKGILKILLNEELLYEFRKNAEYLVRNRFNWDRIAEETERLYAKSLE